MQLLSTPRLRLKETLKPRPTLRIYLLRKVKSNYHSQRLLLLQGSMKLKSESMGTWMSTAVLSIG